MRFRLWLWALVPAATAALWAQHQHSMLMRPAANVLLAVHHDPATHVLTIRLGPVDLPARAPHHAIAQPPPETFAMPMDGWLTAYHPRLVDDASRPLPGRLLHHVAVYNLNRADFLCPLKPEHIFGAGSEMSDWPVEPGFGYQVHRGDRVLVRAMFHNPTDTSYPKTFLEVRVDYAPAGARTPLRNVYPAWFDVKGCGRSSYDLKPGLNVNTGEFKLAYGGVLIGVGGHLHDYGRRVELVDVTRKQAIATIDAKLDAQGSLISIPVVTFETRGGFPLDRDDVVKVTATYDNPTGKPIPEGAMGIAVAYFLPHRPGEMAALARHQP